MAKIRRILGSLATALLAIGALTCVTPAVTEAKKLEKEEVGVWLVEAYSNRDGTAFDHCTMSAVYDDTALLFFIDRDFYWAISMVNDKWQLRKGDKYDVDIHVDKGRTVRHVARVLDEHWVDIAIDDREELFEELRQGETLYIDTPGRAFSFRLTGTSQGLSALFDCVDRYTRDAYQTNPFARPPSVTAAQNGSLSGDATSRSITKSDTPDVGKSDYRIEAKRMLETLLRNAQVSGYAFVESPDASDDYRRFAAIWSDSKGLFGGLYVVPNEEEGLAERTLNTIATSQREDCGGKFVTKTDMSVRMQGAYMPRAYGGCSDGGNSTMLYVSAFQRRQGGFYVLFTMTSEGGSPNEVAEIDERLRQAAYRAR